MSYRLSPLAEQDVEKIWSYVAEDSNTERADRLVDAIVDRFDMLSEHPKMGRLRPEFGPGVRSFAVESHVIYYREKEGDILIARVLHGSRDQTAAWEQSADGGEDDV
jgi:toxin ParE1/3/4